MRILGFLAALSLIAGLPLSGAALEVYLTDDTQLRNFGPPGILEGAGPVTYSVVVDNAAGLASTQGEGCNGNPTVPGEEYCMYNVTFTGDPNCEITSFTGEVSENIVANVQTASVIFNGGDPVLATGLGVTEIATVTLEALGGPCSFHTANVAWVDTNLTRQTEASQTIADSCNVDDDGDKKCNSQDPCPDHFNTFPEADTNGDLIPNSCQCGDINLDGGIGFDDATCFAQCVQGTAQAPCDCNHELADTNGDGTFGFDDATRAAQTVQQLLVSSDLFCVRRPTAGPPPQPI